MSRRGRPHRLAGALLVTFGLLAAPAAAAGGALPLFDGHIHYSRDAWDTVSTADALAVLEEAGIRWALVSSTPDEGTLRLRRAAPNRIVPFLRPYRHSTDIGSWFRDPAILGHLKDRLRAQGPLYRGIGEFHLQGREAKVCLAQRSSCILRAVVPLAAERGLFLHAHSDRGGVEALLALDPAVRVLWAHAGFTAPPTVVEELLATHENLWVELSYRYQEIAPDGTLDPAWGRLFERHPERFVLGSDTWTTPRWGQVPAIAERARGWLEQLPPEVAEAIAYRNALELFRP